MSESDTPESAEINPTTAEIDPAGLERTQDATVLEADPQNSHEIIAAGYAYSGPLPPPQLLQAYGLVQPGLDVKIVDMLIEQTKHRQMLEKAVIAGDGGRSWAGIACAFVLSAMSISGGIYLVANDHDTAGTVLSFGSLASLAGVFVYGTNQRKNERQQKLEAMLNQEASEK